jgi:type II secretory ATPase GspE/PulE/Tfp pilus assembly ATPase PilB-like protein
MSTTLQEQFRQQLPGIAESDPKYVTQLVDVMLTAAQDADASDVHLIPSGDGLGMTWRIDGVLQPVARFPRELSANIVSRLKVLAELLTYQTDVPQEGRIRGGEAVEMRVSTFPTLFGEKAVIRLFVGSGGFRYLDDLLLPEEMSTSLRGLLNETGGVLLITGPAGSGKTTTCYACLRELTEKSPVAKSIASLEDPIEAIVGGVAQSQIKPATGFDYQTGVRSLLRQDPEVLMVGEIRDRETAEIVFQASLTGHLVLTTFHAGSAAEAVGRLLEMGIEPYQLRSGILAVINQRLARRLCACAVAGDVKTASLGLDVQQHREAAGCGECASTGYRNRIVLAEMLQPNTEATARAILSRSDAREIEKLAVADGMISRWRRATEAVNQGLTSAAEVRRVLGFH